MSIYALRDLLELAPELAQHVKQASSLEGYPVGNPSDVLLSNLKLVFGEDRYRDPKDIEKVAMAVDLYNMQEEVQTWVNTVSEAKENLLVKAASDNRDIISKEVNMAERCIEASVSGICDLEKIAEAAEELVDSYPEEVTSATTLIYGGRGYLVKSAAVAALNSRAKVFPEFEKLAHIVEATNTDTLTTSQVRSIANAVTSMDRQTGLSTRGYNFYKEAFITKEAASSALQVNVAGKTVGIEKLLRMPIGDILGNDVAAHMGTDPYEVKAAIEALPRDSQRLLSRYV